MYKVPAVLLVFLWCPRCLQCSCGTQGACIVVGVNACGVQGACSTCPRCSRFPEYLQCRWCSCPKCLQCRRCSHGVQSACSVVVVFKVPGVSLVFLWVARCLQCYMVSKVHTVHVSGGFKASHTLRSPGCLWCQRCDYIYVQVTLSFNIPVVYLVPMVSLVSQVPIAMVSKLGVQVPLLGLDTMDTTGTKDTAGTLET